MNMPTAVKTCMRKYVTFSGRATRSEYWWFVLFCFCIFISTVTLSIISNYYRLNNDFDKVVELFGIILLILLIGLIIPNWSVAVRRLHDAGKSGEYVFWYLLAILGAAILDAILDAVPDSEVLLILIEIPGFVLFILINYWTIFKRDLEDNKYGPSPYKDNAKEC